MYLHSLRYVFISYPYSSISYCHYELLSGLFCLILFVLMQLLLKRLEKPSKGSTLLIPQGMGPSPILIFKQVFNSGKQWMLLHQAWLRAKLHLIYAAIPALWAFENHLKPCGLHTFLLWNAGLMMLCSSVLSETASIQDKIPCMWRIEYYHKHTELANNLSIRNVLSCK